MAVKGLTQGEISLLFLRAHNEQDIQILTQTNKELAESLAATLNGINKKSN